MENRKRNILFSEEQIQEKKLELERVKHLINKKYNYSHDKQNY